jgi:hypothetical protein
MEQISNTAGRASQEAIATLDRLLLAEAKYNRDLSAATAKTHEANHEIMVLKLAVKYKLGEGDNIGADGSITRKANDDAKSQ